MGMCRYCERKKGFVICNGDCLRCARYKEEEMSNLKIIEVNPAIRKNVEADNGYCPCAIWQTPDTKCMCKDFREQAEPGECFCGRFEKVVDDGK